MILILGRLSSQFKNLNDVCPSCLLPISNNSLRLIVFFIRLLSFIASSVIDDDKHARVFYKYVMGGGGFDIHYGIFRKPSDTVYEASKATNERLLTCLDWTHPVTKDSVVLDLGSGHGGISHEVSCFQLHSLVYAFCRIPFQFECNGISISQRFSYLPLHH